MRLKISFTALAFCATLASAQQLSFTGSAADATALKHYQISADQLPPPHATESADNESRVIAAPRDAKLHLPPGFTISVYAEGFDNPRWMALAPNGDVFVAESYAGRISILRDPKHTGHPQKFVF